MKNGKWKSRRITLAVAFVSVGFVGSSYAASSRLLARPAIQYPVQVLDLTRLQPGIVSAPFDPPPDNEDAREVAEVVKEMISKKLPEPGGALPGGGIFDPFPGFF